MADAIKSSLEREKRLESKDTGNSDKFEKYRKTHEKIRKWMDDLSKKYSIDNLAGHVTGIFAKYDKLKQNIRFSKMGAYLNTINDLVEMYKNSPSFSPEKLLSFQTDMSLLILVLKDALEDVNERCENWNELIYNRESISNTADKADDYLLACSKAEKEELFNSVLRNNKSNESAA